MHIIIAGAARAGKTTLSLMLGEKGYVHYKMDSIKRGICEAYNLKYDDWADVSPIMCTIINRIIEDNKTDTNFGKENYLFDTPYIYPKHIEKISAEDTLVIFIGYAHTTAIENFKARRLHDKENLWTRKLSDKQLLKNAQMDVDFSKEIEKECKELGITYFDTSENREEVLNSIIDFIEERERVYNNVKKLNLKENIK